MLDAYNSKQKIAIFAAVFVFIVGNIFAVLLLLSTLSSEQVNIEDEKILVSSNVFGDIETFEYQQGQLIEISDGLIKIEFNQNRFYGAAPLGLILKNNELKINEGNIFIQPANTLKLKIEDSELNLNEGGKYVYLPSERSLLVLSGNIFLRGQKITANNLISWEVDNFNVYKFNREDLTNDEEFRNLNLVLTSFNVDIPELSDTVPPRLFSLTPRDGSILENPNLRISGRTEIGASVNINDSQVEIDGLGNFVFESTLIEGDNSFRLLLTDQYGNQSIVILNYILAE